MNPRPLFHPRNLPALVLTLTVAALQRGAMRVLERIGRAV